MKEGIRNFFFCFFILIPIFLSAQEEENLRRALRFLTEIPNENFTFYERSLLADYGGFGSSLVVSSQISDTEEFNGTFVFAVPLEADFAVDTALAMLERLKGTSVNILVAFLGGERNELPIDMRGTTHKGLRDILTLADMPENWVLCYFDSCSPPTKLVLVHGIRGYVTPLELITPLPALFSSFGIPWSFKIRQNSIYKLGLVEGPEALSITWGEEVNGFVLSGESKSGEVILPGDLADLLIGYAGSLVFPVLNPEKHYSFIAFPGGRVFFVSELVMVNLVLVIVGFFLLFYLFYSVRYNAVLLFHIRLFFKYFLIFVILLSLLIISIKLSGFLYSLLVSVFNPPLMASNQAGLGLTMVLSLLVFSLFLKVLDITRFPLRERFYKFAAVFIILFGMFSAIFLDFSYIPVFFWVFVFFLLGAFVSNPALVFLFAFSLPLFAFITMSNIFLTEYERLTELFISRAFRTQDSWLVTFQTALLILPFLLLAKRGVALSRILLRSKLKLNKKSRYIMIPVLVPVVILAMIVQITIFKPDIAPERRFIMQTHESDILSLSIEDVVFIESRIITLNLAARGNPVRFDVSILSGTEEILLPLYSAPVPFQREDEGKRINLSLGEHPPNPFIIEIVVPLEFHGLLETAAIYNTWDPAIDTGEKPASPDYVLQVSKNARL